jgi:hypothetical protein
MTTITRLKKVKTVLTDEPEEKLLRYELAILNSSQKFIALNSHWKVTPASEQEFLQLMKAAGIQVERWNGW